MNNNISIHYGGYASGKSYRSIQHAIANTKTNFIEVLSLFDNSKITGTRYIFGKLGWYYHSTKKNGDYYTHTFTSYSPAVIRNAISWWSILSYRDHFKTVAKPENLEWYNKGETGIIHMYLNSLK